VKEWHLGNIARVRSHLNVSHLASQGSSLDREFTQGFFNGIVSPW
jgi:hypothetical protein